MPGQGSEDTARRGEARAAVDAVAAVSRREAGCLSAAFCAVVGLLWQGRCAYGHGQDRSCGPGGASDAGFSGLSCLLSSSWRSVSWRPEDVFARRCRVSFFPFRQYGGMSGQCDLRGTKKCLVSLGPVPRTVCRAGTPPTFEALVPAANRRTAPRSRTGFKKIFLESSKLPVNTEYIILLRSFSQY